MKKNKKEMKSQMEIGHPQGGKEIPTPKAGENPKVTVKGTGKAKKQTATWY
jgi:hypothetical protein